MSISLGQAMEDGWRNGLGLLQHGIGRDVLGALEFCQPSNSANDFRYEVTSGGSHLIKGLVSKDLYVPIHLTLNANKALNWETFHVTLEQYGATKGGQHLGSYQIVRASQDEQDHHDIAFKCINNSENFTIGKSEKKFKESLKSFNEKHHIQGPVYSNPIKDMSLLFNFLLTYPNNAPSLAWL